MSVLIPFFIVATFLARPRGVVTSPRNAFSSARVSMDYGRYYGN